MSAEHLCSPRMQRVWFVLAWQTHTSIANIESLHARNRCQADPCSTWESFAAQFVNSEVSVLAKNRSAILAQVPRAGDPSPQGLAPQPSAGGLRLAAASRPETRVATAVSTVAVAPPSEVVAAPAPEHHRRAQSALLLFRRDHLRTEKQLGRSANGCTAESWRVIRAAFAALPPEVRATYESQA
eukprot:174765-Alexandrium_andersonii.AAC.1